MTVDERPQLVPAVKSLLSNLRRKVRCYVWAEGLANSLAWLGAAFWITLAIDWFFEPPVYVRIILLCTAIGVLAAILVRKIVHRAFAHLSDGNMATVLERCFPQLNDSLLTAVVLCNRPAETVECNPEMLSRVCQEAAERINVVRLDEVFNPRPLRNSFTAGILMIFSVILFGILFPNATSTWANRSLALSNELWPRMTRLEIDGFPNGMRKVARGSDVDIVVRADTSMPQIPKVLEIRYREEGGVRGRSTMNRQGVADPAKDKYQEFLYTRRNVLSPIRFDIYGGDDAIRGQTIEVVDNPSVSLTLDCEFPPYMNRPARLLPVTGVMSLPKGSSISIRAIANKELVRVQVDTVADDSVAATPRVIESKDLSADRRSFNFKLDLLDKDTTILFTLFDSDGIKSREPVRLGLAAIEDQSPQISVQLDGIGAAITPQARIGVVGRVLDDYGIGNIWFEYAIDQQNFQTTAIKTAPGHPTELELTSDEVALEVRDLKLKPGQKLQLGVKASDLCNLGKNPNTGAGERWLLDVVTPDQLQIMLKARELVLRQRFESIIQETAETRDILAKMELSDAGSSKTAIPSEQNKDRNNDIKEPSNKTKESTKISTPGSEPNDEPGDESTADSAERRMAMQLMRVQRASSNGRKSAQETLGVAEGIDDIRKQLVNNRIDTQELKERLQSGIADPLRRIANDMYPEFERRLDSLQAALDDAKLAAAARNNAKIQADAILLSMRQVLDRMIELQDYDEMVEILRDIIKMQEQLRDQTQELQKQKIRDLLKE
jgi:hypothetical protein